jgi:hypothetical protein
MPKHNASDQIKAKGIERMYCRNHGMRTHCHDADLQLGAETWAIAKAEKKIKVKEASGAATRRRDIS